MNWEINDCHSDAGTFFKVGAIGKRVNWEKNEGYELLQRRIKFWKRKKKVS